MALTPAEKQKAYRDRERKKLALLRKAVAGASGNVTAVPKPQSAPDTTLSVSAQQKLEAYKRQYKRQLDEEFERRVQQAAVAARNPAPARKAVPLSLEEVIVKLGPILKALQIEAAKKTAGLIAPVIIQGIANDLQRCLSDWILPSRCEGEYRLPLTMKQKRALKELLSA